MAALLHNRKSYGCDKVPEYINIAHNRIARIGNGLKTRPMGKPIYYPIVVTHENSKNIFSLKRFRVPEST